MSNQNRFLLPHTSSGGVTSSTTTTTTGGTLTSSTPSSSASSSTKLNQDQSNSDIDNDNNQHSVDTDFDSYWEEEARNPHRNRIRIGRQYQASVPSILKQGEKDHRKLEDLETLSFCPKKSAKVSDTELDHYFTVAKSLNLFASLVETRSLLGRDVTIADLNHIRNKEGLSLASVIQPTRQTINSTTNNPNVSPSSSQQAPQTTSPNKSPPTNICDITKQATSPTTSSPKDSQLENYAFNQPLMKALSHFINLHHPCHHDRDCKKLLKDIPLEDDSGPAVSITAGNLRQTTASASSSIKPSRSRSSTKQAQAIKEELEKANTEQHQDDHDNVQSPTFEEWTREEVELFSKAIEVCGKNFGSIKKEFLPSKSVKSIVEYYYIGSRDVSDNKKKSNQPVETSDGCSSPEKIMANNNGQGGNGGGPSAGGKSGASSNLNNQFSLQATTSTSSSSTTTTTNRNTSSTNDKTSTDSSGENTVKQARNSSIKSVTPKNLSKVSSESQDSHSNSSSKAKTKNIDARMSVYNFDEELKEDNNVKLECPRPGAEVKPLKAKPIRSNSALDSEGSNSNVGSLKFFMDGELVLKLNACQEQQEGIDKCHWVQSGEKIVTNSRQKRYTKRNSDKSSTDSYQNGSQTNSVVSSYQDDDSKNEDLTGDEDSKDSANSIGNLPTQQQKQQKNQRQSLSPSKKKPKVKNEPNSSNLQSPSPQQHQHSLSSIDYNKLAINNRMKEINGTNINNSSPVINQTMPWYQANSFAMAAALLSGLPFPPSASNMMDSTSHLPPPPPPTLQNNINNSVNLNSKPMDLSLEHTSPKSLQKSSRACKAKPKNN